MPIRIVQVDGEPPAIVIDVATAREIAPQLRDVLDDSRWTGGRPAPHVDELLWTLDRIGEGRPDMTPEAMEARSGLVS